MRPAAVSHSIPGMRACVRAKQREGALQPRNINISFHNNSKANVYGIDIMHIDNVYKGIQNKEKITFIKVFTTKKKSHHIFI